MKAPDQFRSRPEPPALLQRDRALKSAIALRICSLGPQGAGASGGTFRRLMREQALRWRQPQADARGETRGAG